MYTGRGRVEVRKIGPREHKIKRVKKGLLSPISSFLFAHTQATKVTVFRMRFPLSLVH